MKTKKNGNLQQEPVDDSNGNNSNQDIHPFDDEDKLDMASIISGAVKGDDDDDDDDDHDDDGDDDDDDDEDARVQAGEEGATAFFEKNLGEHFDTSEEVSQPATAASAIGSKPHQLKNRKNGTADVKLMRCLGEMLNAPLMNLRRCLGAAAAEETDDHDSVMASENIDIDEESASTAPAVVQSPAGNRSDAFNHQPKKYGVASKGPFRDSKLTNINPASDDYDETQHVISYAITA